MKSTALWALVVLNVVLAGVLITRDAKPNAAVAQVANGGGRPGDYIVIPVDFPGATVGSVVVLDNVSGQMSAIQTTEDGNGQMRGLRPINVADIFARNAGGPARPTPRR